MVSKEQLEQHREGLKERLEKLRADAHAVSGALQFVEHLLGTLNAEPQQSNVVTE